MVALRLEGRFGNQLFQYAFIYAAAKELNTSFYIDQHTEKFIPAKYFKIPTSNRAKFIASLFNITGFKNFFSFHLRRFFYKNTLQFYKLSLQKHNFEDEFNEVRLQNNTLYYGFFQSELFFIKFEKLIRETYSLKDTFIDQFNNKYDNLYQNNKIITVHIRRTDYIHLGHLNLGGSDLSLPVEYYKKAIAQFDTQKVHFIFISDDINFVYENFREVTNKTVSEDSEIMDFQHLLNADVCIISNSTFSWWGAWLNNKPTKVIYAPKYFMGWRIKKEIPDHIYPIDWTLIDVT